jgi:hypothetical protein
MAIKFMRIIFILKLKKKIQIFNYLKKMVGNIITENLKVRTFL